MAYYKLIKAQTFIGVATNHDFRVFQKKHKRLLVCDEQRGQYVHCGDNLYRDNWMVPVNNDQIEYINATVIRIEKSEYDILCDAVNSGEDIRVEQEQQPQEVDIQPIYPNDVVTIDYLKASKIAEMSSECNKVIENGVDVMMTDGSVRHFSLTTQDQLNLITLQSMIEAGETMVPYHADGELCRYYSAEDILAVINAATSHKTFHVIYFNSLKAYINSMNDMDEISAVNYGMTIPDECQSDILRSLYASIAQ